MKNFFKKKKKIKIKSPSTETSPPKNDLDLDAMLKRKQDYLTSKEKELKELQKKLEKKMNELKKKSNTKAKADLRAAKKLNKARKKLTAAVDVTEKVEKKRKKKKICKICDPTQCNWVDKIHGMVENLLNCDRCPCFSTKKQTFSNMCEQYFKKAFASCPCEDNVGGYCTPGKSSSDSSSDGPRKYSYFDAATDDCFRMAMGRMPLGCGFPACSGFSSRPAQRTRCRTLKLFMVCFASFLFWSPCLLILLLCKCFCCFCNSDC